MLRAIKRHSLAAAFVVAGVSGLLAMPGHAADSKVDKPTTAKKSDASKTDGASADSNAKASDNEAKSDAPAKIEFKVPDGTPEDLLKYIKKVEKTKPKTKTRPELIEFYKDSRKAIAEAAEKMLASNPDGATAVKAAEKRIGALRLLQQLGDSEAKQQADEQLEKIKADKRPEMQRFAKLMAFQERIPAAMRDPDAADKLMDDIMQDLKTDPSKDLAQLAGALARRHEQDAPATTIKTLKELAGIVSKAKDPEVAEVAKRFEGAIRRMNLPGKPIEIKGTLVDGTPFDQSTLKGKVVLVDFWATWCGPCIMELPNVKKNYEKYHDKGFTVVGISLDEDRDALVEFIAKEKLPWPILFPQDEKDQYWNNPLAVYYGVESIPNVILTNQKGEVVSLEARGPELGKKLEELLGKVEDKDEKADEKKPDDKKTDEKKSDDAPKAAKK